MALCLRDDSDAAQDCVAGISWSDARYPSLVQSYAVWTYYGRPRSSIRFSASTAKSLVDIPVAGYGESAMVAASMLGERAGVLLFIGGMAATVDRNVERMGLSSRFVGATDVGFTFNDVLAAYQGDAAPLIGKFQAAARTMIGRGADVIIPGEASLCILLARHGVTEVEGVPVLDAVTATIKVAEMMVGMRRAAGVAPSRRGYFRSKPPRARLKELLDFYGLAQVGQDR